MPPRKISVSSRLFLALAAIATFAHATSADDVSFNRDVKAILSDNCFTCHGPDEAQRVGGFRLDDRASSIAEADSGETPIVPGDTKQSELIARITTDDDDLRMPPAESGKQLTKKQIDILKRWVQQGAEYEQHWAFVVPQRPDVPQAGWGDQPIDQFIAARLSTAGLQPAKRADRETLLRRVTLDLTGLPPSPADRKLFLNDDSPDAFEKVVDRLLASPHFGERMALPWLDQARYADSNGYQSDGSRDMWAWRDWVINAFNRNLPFDQFSIEQLAGDMLPDATQDQIIATGFNRNHRLNGEGGRIVEEWFVETVIDRVETTSMTWLGLTMNCCRCHDHKYDPISQREFYQMFAYFNSNDESGVLAPNGKNGDNTPPVLELPTDEQLAKETEIKSAISDLEKTLKDHQSKIAELADRWAEKEREKNEHDPVDAWMLLTINSAKSVKGATLERLEDESYLATGKNPGNDVYEITAPISGQISGLLLEVFTHESLPTKSLGRGSNGNFVLTGVEATLIAPSLKKPKPIFLKTAVADFEQSGWTAQSILGSNPKPNRPGKNRKGWAIEGLKAENRVARKVMLLSDKVIDVPKDATLTITMRHDSPFADHNVGRFRFSTTSKSPDEVKLSTAGLPAEIDAIIRSEPDQRTKKNLVALQKYFRENVPNPISKTKQAIDRKRKELTAHQKSFSSTMVMREAEPRDAFVLTRGEYDKPADKVQRGVPSFFATSTTPKDRLELARWIVARDNPLTARVWVNRTWEQFFGNGIVKTTENLGSQSEYPSHPELLDWLAVEFMEPTVMPPVNGQSAKPWDMKSFIKMIVMSQTYQQSSHVDQQKWSIDPDNRLISRGPRFRLTGELIRDAALSASGLLVDKVGGPSVRPYMPDGVWDETSKYGNLRNYKHDNGDGLYRRTMYTIWKRTAAPPSMLIFDAPNRETCTVKRSRTNTPLQALSLLNEVTFVEASRALASRMIMDGSVDGGDSVESRIAHGFQLVVSRNPTTTEMRVLADGLRADLARFRSDQEAAKKLIAFGDSKADSDITPEELAAYTLTANILLNLDEFVTKE